MALSLISIGLCQRSERKARLLPSPASDFHLASYFKPLFCHHKKIHKINGIYLKGHITSGWRDRRLWRQDRGKARGGINRSLKLIIKLQRADFLCKCQPVICHPRTWQTAEMNWRGIWHRCLTSPSNPSLHYDMDLISMATNLKIILQLPERLGNWVWFWLWY